jgi:hypothetical protein
MFAVFGDGLAYIGTTPFEPDLTYFTQNGAEGWIGYKSIPGLGVTAFLALPLVVLWCLPLLWIAFREWRRKRAAEGKAC